MSNKECTCRPAGSGCNSCSEDPQLLSHGRNRVQHLRDTYTYTEREEKHEKLVVAWETKSNEPWFCFARKYMGCVLKMVVSMFRAIKFCMSSSCRCMMKAQWVNYTQARTTHKQENRPWLHPWYRGCWAAHSSADLIPSNTIPMQERHQDDIKKEANEKKKRAQQDIQSK